MNDWKQFLVPFSEFFRKGYLIKYRIDATHSSAEETHWWKVNPRVSPFDGLLPSGPAQNCKLADVADLEKLLKNSKGIQQDDSRIFCTRVYSRQKSAQPESEEITFGLKFFVPALAYM